MTLESSNLLAGKQVLVIEDDDSTAWVVAFVLKEAGAEVVEANSAFQALRKFHQFPLAAIVCDLRLPDMYGGELLQRLRLRQATVGSWIPSVALTGLAGEETQRRALEAGFDRFLTKPTGFEELISTLLDLLPKAR